MTYEIVWPERRIVSAYQIRDWYLDAVGNGNVEKTKLTDIEDMAEEMHSAGLIMLGRGSRE
jgi:hypothetical protein